MKRIFLILFAVIAVLEYTNAQEKDGETVKQVEVVLDSLPLTRTELLDKSKEWIGKAFNSGEKVITSETENSIVGHYNETVNVGSTLVYFDHLLMLDFKDSKVRMRIWTTQTTTGSSASSLFYPAGQKTKKIYNDWLTRLHDQALGVRDRYTSFIRQKKEEW